MEAQSFISEQLVDHAVNSKANCNTVKWSLMGHLSWAGETGIYLKTTPVVISWVNKFLRLRDYRMDSLPNGKSSGGIFFNVRSRCEIVCASDRSQSVT